MPAIRGADSKKKTRRYRRDLDQILDDLSTPRHLELYHETKDPNELPALGEHYCIPCAKWFESEHNFNEHKRAKPHKKRLRALKADAYTQKDAEAAAGLFTDNGKRSEPMAIDDVMTTDPAAAIMDVDPAASLVQSETEHDGGVEAIQ